MKHLSPWRNETDATATNPKMMPRQHSGPGNSSEIPMQTRSGRERVMQDGGVIPDYRVPMGRRHGKRGGTCKDNSDTVQTYGTSHTTHAFDHGRSSRGYTFEACISERIGS